MSSAVNLHEIAALQNVHVRQSVDLRPMKSEDGPRMLEIINSDPTIRQAVNMASYIHTQADFDKEIHDYEARDDLMRYALLVDLGIAGLVSFWRDSGWFGNEPELNQYGFGYFVAPEFRGQGIAADAVKAIMDVAESVLTVESFVAYCFGKNAASQQVLETAGFERVLTPENRPRLKPIDKMYIKQVSHGQASRAR